MNLIYIAKNPSPVPQTITIPQGMPLAHGRLYSSESITIEVPPMTQREIRFNEEGKPIIEGCIQDLSIAEEYQEGTQLDMFSNRRVRTRIESHSDNYTTSFFEKTVELYPQLEVDHNKCIGGAQLIAQFSHLRSVRDNSSAIYSPAALNMSVTSRADSLFNAAKTGLVHIESVIGDGHDSPNAIRMDIHNPGHTTVRCVVPQGAMFEQITWNGKQNLVVKQDVWIEIQPGQTGNFPLPAFCANASAGSPQQNQMNLTPFVFNDMGETFRDQASMWRTTDSQRNVRL